MAKRRHVPDRRPGPQSPVPIRAERGSTGRGMVNPLRSAPGASPVRRAVLATIGTLAVLLFVAVGGFPGSQGASPSPDGPTTAPSPGATAARPSPSPSTMSETPAPTSAVPVVSGVACDVDEKTAYHVHAHLNIRFEGELQPIPADVGIGAGCLFWLHTHAPHGVIHVEAPAESAFTLGQFFDVWGQPLSSTEVAGRQVGPGATLYAFVDREPYDGDPRAIILGDLVAIELQVGPAPLEPLPYTFPAELE